MAASGTLEEIARPLAYSARPQPLPISVVESLLPATLEFFLFPSTYWMCLELAVLGIVCP
jgi:hypothetical protein